MRKLYTPPPKRENNEVFVEKLFAWKPTVVESEIGGDRYVVWLERYKQFYQHHENINGLTWITPIRKTTYK